MEITYPKSKRCLRQSFLALLNENDYHEISVKDIVEHARLGRTTFYLHYKDKSALLHEFERELSCGFTELLRKATEFGSDDFLRKIVREYHPVFVEYFQFFRRNSYAFTALFRPGNGLNFLKTFNRAVYDYRMDSYDLWLEEGREGKRSQGNLEESKASSFDLRRYQNLVVANFTNFFIYWLMNGMEPSEEEMAMYLCREWKSHILTMGETDADPLYQRLLMVMHEEARFEAM